jgi:hypothetical protein
VVVRAVWSDLVSVFSLFIRENTGKIEENSTKIGICSAEACAFQGLAG